MDRKRISASNIRSVGYDARNCVLEIEFGYGGICQFQICPKKSTAAS